MKKKFYVTHFLYSMTDWFFHLEFAFQPTPNVHSTHSLLRIWLNSCVHDMCVYDMASVVGVNVVQTMKIELSPKNCPSIGVWLQFGLNKPDLIRDRIFVMFRISNWIVAKIISGLGWCEWVQILCSLRWFYILDLYI